MFQSQKDGVLIFSTNDAAKDVDGTPAKSIQVELFNTAFTDLVQVDCDEFSKTSLDYDESRFDMRQFTINDDDN